MFRSYTVQHLAMWYGIARMSYAWVANAYTSRTELYDIWFIPYGIEAMRYDLPANGYHIIAMSYCIIAMLYDIAIMWYT